MTPVKTFPLPKTEMRDDIIKRIGAAGWVVQIGDEGLVVGIGEEA